MVIGAIIVFKKVERNLFNSVLLSQINDAGIRLMSRYALIFNITITFIISNNKFIILFFLKIKIEYKLYTIQQVELNTYVSFIFPPVQKIIEGIANIK